MHWTLPDLMNLPQSVYTEVLNWIREEGRKAAAR